MLLLPWCYSLRSTVWAASKERQMSKTDVRVEGELEHSQSSHCLWVSALGCLQHEARCLSPRPSLVHMPTLPRSGVEEGPGTSSALPRPARNLESLFRAAMSSAFHLWSPRGGWTWSLETSWALPWAPKMLKKDTKGIWGPAWTLDPCHQGTKASLAFTHFPGVLPFDFWLGRKRELEVAGCGKFVLALNLSLFAP